jgi:hypothetical protein
MVPGPYTKRCSGMCPSEVAGDDRTLPDDTKLEDNIMFNIRILTHSEAADRRFEKDIGFGTGILTQNYALGCANRRWLEMIGRRRMTQNSYRILGLISGFSHTARLQTEDLKRILVLGRDSHTKLCSGICQ